MIYNLTIHLTVALAFLSAQVIAQQKTVSGTVTDEKGQPLVGVNIVLAGTNSGTSTDFDGTYHIEASPGQRLRFSYIGYKAASKLIGESRILNVQLRPASKELQEIVVAYGKAEKSSVVGSAASINLDAIEKSAALNLATALSGLSPGIEISGETGQPGSVASIRIRGTGSINTSKGPLYVVDGLPNGTQPDLHDIASVTVLKDAAAAALYGSRAANGVILVTTKSGQAGKTVFSLKTETGYSDFAVNMLPLASPKQAFDYKVVSVKNYLLEYRQKDYPEGREKQAQDFAINYVKKQFPLYDPNRPDSDYDWVDALFKIGHSNTVNLSASGGTRKAQFYTALNYREAKGVSIGSDYEQLSGLLNLTHHARDRIEFGLKNAIKFYERHTVNSGGYYYSNPIYASRSGFLCQLIPIREKDGSFTEIPNRLNPVKERGLTKNQMRAWDDFTQGYGKLQLVKGLTLQSTNSFNMTQTYTLNWRSPDSRDGKAFKGYIKNSNRRNLILQTSNILNYNQTFRQSHRIDFLMGYEAEETIYKYISTSGTRVPSGRQTLDVAAKPKSAYSHEWKDRIQSVLSRLKYNYKDKYYGAISYRTDASSKLAKKWGQFWSLSGTWNISAERWMKNVSPIDYWTLRASVGQNGNIPKEVGGVAYRGLYSFGHRYDSEPGMWYDAIYNKDLGWEKNTTYGLATEAKLFDFLSLNFEYYQRITKDLLLQAPVSRATGFSSQFRNIGQISNKGFEVGISTVNVKKKDFLWKTDLNVAHNENKIEKLYAGEDIASNNIFPLIYREGKSIHSFYLRDWAGVNPKNGHGRWYVLEDEHRVDKDRDGKYDVTADATKATKRIVGCGDPDLTGNLTNALSYKEFDLSFSIYFKLGGDAYLPTSNLIFDDGKHLNKPVQKVKLKGYWQKPGDRAKLPKVVMSNPQHTDFNSSRRLFHAGYMRLKNITLGYSIPPRALSKLHLSNIRLYMSANNILTFSGIEDFDPETSAGGSLLDSYFPPLKTINFGIQLKL